MSWYNPSQEEAEEAYAYYRNRYYDAAGQRNTLMRQEQEYASQRRAASARMSDLSGQKLNFEKRLDGIIKIIKILEGTGVWCSANVPDAISRARSSVQKTDESYQQSIRMSGGISAASMETVFSVKIVEGDPRSASALQTYKTEKARLEQSIADLKRQITCLSDQISHLTRQVNSCCAAQISLRNTMNSSAYEMNHYRRYMY